MIRRRAVRILHALILLAGILAAAQAQRAYDVFEFGMSSEAVLEAARAADYKRVPSSHTAYLFPCARRCTVEIRNPTEQIKIRFYFDTDWTNLHEVVLESDEIDLSEALESRFGPHDLVVDAPLHFFGSAALWVRDGISYYGHCSQPDGRYICRRHHAIITDHAKKRATEEATPTNPPPRRETVGDVSDKF